LPAHGTESARDKRYCYNLSPFFSAILALFFAAVGGTLCLYSFNKSREVGGWAVFIWIISVPFFGIALGITFEGIFGWDIRHVSASCNGLTENVRVLPVVIPELEFVKIEGAKRALPELPENRLAMAYADRAHGLQGKPA
jgi:hypothetical protein